MFVKQAKNFAQGFSRALHNGFTTITYWNNYNSVCFMDNDIESNRESWETVGVRNKGKEIGVHTSKVAVHYRSICG